MITIRPTVAPKREAHAVAMDAQRDRVGSSIVAALELPDWLELARAARDGADVREAIDRARDDVQEAIAAGMLSGVCIAILARQTERLPIVVPARAAEFRAEALPRFDTPEAALEYWRARLGLTAAQVEELREELRRFWELARPLAGDVTRATVDTMETFLRETIGLELPGDEFARRFAEAVGKQARAATEATVRTEIARSYGERRLVQAREGGMRGTMITPFIQFLSTPDDRRTPICRAMHRYIAATDDPVWDELSPPLHWRCRSDISLMPYTECIRRGIVAYAPGGRGLVYTRGWRPFGDPPETTIDEKGREIPVRAQTGFGGRR